MSDEEKYKIIGKVVHDHEARKKHLAALEVKAKALGEFVHLVANALTGQVRQYTFRDDGQIAIASFNVSRGGSGVWPSFDELRSLLQEIDSTRDEIADLERQRKELGV